MEQYSFEGLLRGPFQTPDLNVDLEFTFLKPLFLIPQTVLLAYLKLRRGSLR